MAEQKYLRKVTDVDVAESLNDGDTLILIRSGKAMRVPTSEVGEKVSTAAAVSSVATGDTLVLIRSGNPMRVPASAVGEKVSTATTVSSVADGDTIPIVRSGSVYRAPASALANKPAIYMYTSGSGGFYTSNSISSQYRVTAAMMKEALKNGVVRYYNYNPCGPDMEMQYGQGLGTILSYQYKDCKHTVYCTLAGENESYVFT